MWRDSDCRTRAHAGSSRAFLSLSLHCVFLDSFIFFLLASKLYIAGKSRHVYIREYLRFVSLDFVILILICVCLVVLSKSHFNIDLCSNSTLYLLLSKPTNCPSASKEQVRYTPASSQLVVLRRSANSRCTSSIKMPIATLSTNQKYCRLPKFSIPANRIGSLTFTSLSLISLSPFIQVSKFTSLSILYLVLLYIL